MGSWSLSGKDVDVQPLVWGTPSPKCSPPYDVIVGCDIMYIREAIPDLVDTLMQLSDSKTKIIFSYELHSTVYEAVNARGPFVLWVHSFTAFGTHIHGCPLGVHGVHVFWFARADENMILVRSTFGDNKSPNTL